MHPIDELLAALRKTPPTPVLCRTVKADATLQPRNPSLPGSADRARLLRESEAHIAAMAARLTAAPDRETEPVLIAREGRTLWLVDGHHRLMAYRRSGRLTIPARIANMSKVDAAHVAKLANLGQTALALHPEQARECAWQHLALLTEQGRRELPKGVTRRSLAGLFGEGVQPSTVQRMLKRLPNVNPEDYSEQACDPATNWPQWKHVKGNAWRDLVTDLSANGKAQRVAADLAKLVAKHDADAIKSGITLWRAEMAAEDADATAEAQALAELVAEAITGAKPREDGATE